MKRLIVATLLACLSTHVTAQSCTGDLVWKESASICIPTCTAHYYPDRELCPTRTISRCVCPEGLIKLEDTSDKCVDAKSEECEKATKKYMDDPSSQFKFSKEPEDLTVDVGNSVTLNCLVSNEYTIQYIWYKLNELPQGDATADKNLYMTGTSVLVFKDITPEEAGFYQCKAVADSNFMMISGVGEVKVKHFTTGDKIVSDKLSTLDHPLVQIKCADISANPKPRITWYFEDAPVSFENTAYFMNSNKESGDYGSLYIQNVQEAHAGKYSCSGTSSDMGKTVSLAERNLKITGSQNTVSGAPKVLEIANHGDKKKKNKEAELYCAGYGYPPPEIRWSKVAPFGQNQPEIVGCTESHCVSQEGRKLTIYKLQEKDFADYQCDVTNSYDHITKILPLTMEAESYNVEFESISLPVKIMPNRYTSFTLTCVIDTSLNSKTYMGWYQNTYGIDDKGDRIQIFSERTPSGQSVQKLVFDYPTNDDHGVFQCLAYNSRTFKQATTDVYVYMTQGVDKDYSTDGDFGVEMYDPNAVKEYKYFSEAKTAAGAEAECRLWRTNAHLAAILNYEDNDGVFDVIMKNKDETNETRAWIGLTDEAQEGVWQWLSGEVSDRFCFWWNNHPDNSEMDRDYAFMDAAKSGHWLDGTTAMKLPFICKHYTASCVDLSNRTEGEIEFQSYVHRRVSSSISVYDKASVKCGDDIAVLVCAPSGKWVPEDQTICPQIEAIMDRKGGGKSSGLGLSFQTILVLLILSYLLT